MSAVVAQNTCADAAAGAMSLHKRKHTEQGEHEPEHKIAKVGEAPQTTSPTTEPPTTSEPPETAFSTHKARKVRLDQNRKAARESRRRKKIMIEELQRSVIFFSRANGALKHQNDELSRLLIQAQAQIASLEDGKKEESKASASFTNTEQVDGDSAFQQAQAQAVATQAIYESKGFPAAAARAAALAMNANESAEAPSAVPSPTEILAMQPGATMQAMANFQQAATAAMQTAIQGMQDIPGVNMMQLAATPVGANAQQAYTDTMTAISMQQAAAAAAAGSHIMMQSAFMTHPSLLWPESVVQATQPPTQAQQETMETVQPVNEVQPANGQAL
jgi:hypothetical protein